MPNNKGKLYDIGTTFGWNMAIGFALLGISPLHEKSVYEELGRIPEVVELHPLFGEYDILLKIECNDIDSIGEVVINKIRATKGVVDTKTLIGTKSLSG
jgi:DNA-binding Lrp family transcriptional regulator